MTLFASLKFLQITSTKRFNLLKRQHSSLSNQLYSALWTSNLMKTKTRGTRKKTSQKRFCWSLTTSKS